MNFFEKNNIRYPILAVLMAVQIIGLMPQTRSLLNIDFTVICIYGFSFVGFLSLDSRQFLINILMLTVPTLLFFLVLFLSINIVNSQFDNVLFSLIMPLKIWGLILLVALPCFGGGFLIRQCLLSLFKKVKKLNT